MRPNTPDTYTNIGTNQGETRFSLDENATAHLISVLTDIASDPIAYFIREYSTNALDSHIEAGVDTPIKVTLPSTAKPFFEVQDFGLGLSVDELQNIYIRYGNSTKRESDEVNGLLGLGSKSALTYSPTFTITAVKGGVKVIAAVAKDADGVGTFKVLDSVGTTEGNGVTITIPIRERDIDRVRQKAAQFYRYFPVGSVLVNGEEPVTVWDDPNLVWLDDDVAVLPSGHKSYIVQHNVAYPVDNYKLDIPFSVVAFVPSGSVNFTPSREALHFTRRTEETLAVLSEYAAEAIERVVQDKILNASTPIEKLRLIIEWRSYAQHVAREFFASIGGHHVKLPRPAWRYNPQAYRRSSSKVGSLSWSDLAGNESILVTGYPLKTVSQLTKIRLDELYPDSRSIYLLPEGTSLAPLEGREGIISWDDVVAATPDAKVPRLSGSSSGPTTYETYALTCRYGQRYSVEELREVEGPLLYVTSEQGQHFANKLPEAHVVEIRWTQEDKFNRLFPEAQLAHLYLGARLEEAEAAITDDDRLAASIGRSDLIHLATVADRIEDPDLAKIIELHAAPSSATLAAFARLGGHVEADHPLVAEVEERYPLLNTLTRYEIQANADELSHYLNAKWASLGLEVPKSNA